MPYLMIRNRFVQEEYSIFPVEKKDSFSVEEAKDFENEWKVVSDPEAPFETEEDAIVEIRKILEKHLQNQSPQVMSGVEKLTEILERLVGQQENQQQDDQN